MRTKFLLLCTLLCLVGSKLFAQTQDRKVSIVLLGGISNYAGDWSNDFFKFDSKTLDNNRVVGGSVNYYLNKSFDLSLMGTYGGISAYTNDTRRFKDFITQVNLNIKYKFGIKMMPY